LAATDQGKKIANMYLNFERSIQGLITTMMPAANKLVRGMSVLTGVITKLADILGAKDFPEVKATKDKATADQIKVLNTMAGIKESFEE